MTEGGSIMTTNATAGTDTLNVLLADDDQFMRSIVASVIRRAPRHDVVTAGSGREALDRLAAHRPAIGVALLDFVMPEGNGLEVAQKIRTGQAGVPRDLPIAMLTGRSDSGLVRAAIELDVNAYVVKPVTREVLFARLERVRTIPIDLKPADVYKAVDIPNPEGADRQKAAPQPGLPPPPPPPPVPCGPMPRVERLERRIADLQGSEILALPVRSNVNNEIILPGHIRLDRALVARLSDLSDLGMIPPVVFIIANKRR